MWKTVTILLFAFLALSCSTDNQEDGIVHVDLEGDWILEDVSCSCFFEPDTDFSTHRISFAGSSLVVINEEDNTFFDEAGEYNYTVEGNLITLSNGSQYRYLIDDQILQLNFVDDRLLIGDEATFRYYKK